MKTDIELRSRAVVCHVTGEIDGDTSPALARALDDALSQARPSRELRVDLSGVTLLTASGLSALVQIREAAAASGSPRLLIAPSPIVRRVLDLTGTSQLFTVQPATRPSPASATIDRALLQARTGLEEKRWHPGDRDRAAVAALMPELAWVTPIGLPSLPSLHVRADRLQAVVAELALAALTTHGELSALFSQCVAALAPDDQEIDGQGALEEVLCPSYLSDAESAVSRLSAFLQAIAGPHH